MEQLNAKFDDILTNKMQYIMDSVALKTQKMTNGLTPEEDKKDKVDYTAKQTLSKIAAEQDRKYKSSKAYKNAQDYKCI
jgi:hypothetical protein